MAVSTRSHAYAQIAYVTSLTTVTSTCLEVTALPGSEQVDKPPTQLRKIIVPASKRLITSYTSAEPRRSQLNNKRLLDSAHFYIEIQNATSVRLPSV